MAQEIEYQANVQERRAPLYPKQGDGLDVLFKLIEHFREQGHQLPADVIEYADRCRHVKESMPK